MISEQRIHLSSNSNFHNDSNINNKTTTSAMTLQPEDNSMHFKNLNSLILQSLEAQLVSPYYLKYHSLLLKNFTYTIPNK